MIGHNKIKTLLGFSTGVAVAAFIVATHFGLEKILEYPGMLWIGGGTLGVLSHLLGIGVFTAWFKKRKNKKHEPNQV